MLCVLLGVVYWSTIIIGKKSISVTATSDKIIPCMKAKPLIGRQSCTVTWNTNTSLKIKFKWDQWTDFSLYFHFFFSRQIQYLLRERLKYGKLSLTYGSFIFSVYPEHCVLKIFCRGIQQNKIMLFHRNYDLSFTNQYL